LLDDVCKLLPLLFTLVHFLFKVSDLSAKNVEPMAICGSVGDGADEGCIRVFEGLTSSKYNDDRVVARLTNRVLLFTSKLAWCLEVDTKIGEIAFVIFADIFYGVDVERNGKPMDGQNDSLSFAVHEYLDGSELV
jgi:hypothetical protein